MKNTPVSACVVLWILFFLSSNSVFSQLLSDAGKSGIDSQEWQLNKSSAKALRTLDVAQNAGSELSEVISVRESTTDLQVKVGEKLFVFGKAQGTLDKVKVGMNLLQFAQVPDVEGISSGFKHVSWKRIKDGSIQIQSSYSPWPISLIWTVLANGQLKMEAIGSIEMLGTDTRIGLGFDYPEEKLLQIKWSSLNLNQGVEEGLWETNSNELVSRTENDFPEESLAILESLKSLELQFDEIVLDIHTSTPGVALSLLPYNSLSNRNNFRKSDLIFSPNLGNESSKYSQLTEPVSSFSKTEKTNKPNNNSFVLLFDFK
jgi:hypothetical protein